MLLSDHHLLLFFFSSGNVDGDYDDRPPEEWIKLAGEYQNIKDYL